MLAMHTVICEHSSLEAIILQIVQALIFKICDRRPIVGVPVVVESKETTEKNKNKTIETATAAGSGVQQTRRIRLKNPRVL